ncbi:unnamed protein product [Brachionus calyciflorus]|uniref:RING-type domain-containing protein n=1 Tax=Brachionus calyciflorus TaxID=104777 RepID=A0A813MKB0_9BILA|nr:unnamed protein product [Brachionus calyciflorus]
MSRNSNNSNFSDQITNPVNQIQNELRGYIPQESETVINMLNPNNFNNLINDAVNNQQQQQQQNQQNSENEQAQNQQPPESNPGIGPMIARTLQTSFPFVLIGLVKLLHQHFFGFLIVLGFLVTQHYANKILVDQIQLKDKKSNKKLVLLIGYLLVHITIFYQIFKENNLENCLIFLSPDVKKMDTWNLIWIVMCSDTIFKFLVICIKALFTIFAENLVSIQTRGNIFSTIETFGLFYRCLIPIHPWILFIFFFEDNDQSPKTLPLFLCIFYIIFKLNQIYNAVNELLQSIRDLLLSIPYGTTPVVSNMDDVLCPICQDKLKKPINLKCQHIFCQDCVCTWLDKENSCPMCRTKIFVKKPKFRDGSTSFSIQWF